MLQTGRQGAPCVSGALSSRQTAIQGSTPVSGDWLPVNMKFHTILATVIANGLCLHSTPASDQTCAGELNGLPGANTNFSRGPGGQNYWTCHSQTDFSISSSVFFVDCFKNCILSLPAPSEMLRTVCEQGRGEHGGPPKQGFTLLWSFYGGQVKWFMGIIFSHLLMTCR